jgi:hypothetical protein
LKAMRSNTLELRFELFVNQSDNPLCRDRQRKTDESQLSNIWPALP